jgi:uncharacterized membrane protein YqhA
MAAIPSIRRLPVSMNKQHTDNRKIMPYVTLHMTFVVSALLLDLLDQISFASDREK